MKIYELDDLIYKSRRGDYKLAIIKDKIVEWEPRKITNNKRDLAVISEIQYAIENRLHEHFYWFNEPEEFIKDYTDFYTELFTFKWFRKIDSRNNIVISNKCCLSLVQYNNGILYAYSRSTDMRNGYFSDRRVLDYLAQKIEERFNIPVHKIRWYMAVPHVYINEGIARRKQ